MQNIIKLIALSSINKKDLKHAVTAYEKKKFKNYLNQFSVVCDNLKLKRIQIYEKLRDTDYFCAKPALDLFYYYNKESHSITKKICNDYNYDCEEVVKEIEDIVEVNSLFDKMCSFLIKKYIKFDISDIEEFLESYFGTEFIDRSLK